MAGLFLLCIDLLLRPEDALVHALLDAGGMESKLLHVIVFVQELLLQVLHVLLGPEHVLCPIVDAVHTLS